MRRREQPVDLGSEEPPPELLRFRPSQTPPTMPDGRPMPWAVKWSAEEFSAWLRARTAWRDTHAEPLPGLRAIERHALDRIGVPAALIAAEKAALSRPPEWVQRAQARKFSTRGGIGRLPGGRPAAEGPGGHPGGGGSA